MMLSKFRHAAVCGAALTLAAAVTGAPVDFNNDVKPILEQNCVSCHNAKHADENGKYNIENKTEAFKPRKQAQRIIPNKPDESKFYTYLNLPAREDKHMPPHERDQLSQAQISTIKTWIAEGAAWPDGATLTNVLRVNFKRDIQPMLEDGGPLADKSVDLLKLWLSQGGDWPAGLKIGAGVATPKHEAAAGAPRPDFLADVLPILEGPGPLSDGAKDTLRKWAAAGAPWPAGAYVGGPNKRMVIVNDIYKKIAAGSPEKAEADMKGYTNAIPGTKVTYSMMPIPGGEFVMGSPAGEAGRNPDEGPQHKVRIDPFWMEKCEVTWNEYELFMYPDENHAASPTEGTTNYTDAVSDAVSRPTKPYVEMSFGMGKDGYPAISMTQHGCNIYCQWLSAKTGHFYRLPTEAEWEYACRAGTTTAYFFGDDPKQLGDYAWYADNSDGKYQKVGVKKPNPWGLYDIIGNVVEWTLDQYDADYYKKFTDTVTNPWNKAVTPYPHVVRGGSWQDDPDKLRSACRRGSTPDWKVQDPQLPKSVWYHTDAPFLGFRIVRPLKVPSAAEMDKYWHSGVEKD